jgi:hypothetical protein
VYLRERSQQPKRFLPGLLWGASLFVYGSIHHNEINQSLLKIIINSSIAAVILAGAIAFACLLLTMYGRRNQLERSELLRVLGSTLLIFIGSTIFIGVLTIAHGFFVWLVSGGSWWLGALKGGLLGLGVGSLYSWTLWLRWRHRVRYWQNEFCKDIFTPGSHGLRRVLLSQLEEASEHPSAASSGLITRFSYITAIENRH